MKPEPIAEYVITPHAEFQMSRRGIAAEVAQDVLAEPAQRIEVHSGRVVLQKIIPDASSGRDYLVRVFVNVDRQPAEVITAYRTSKLSKYWKE